MSDCRRQWNREDELPVYLAKPISTGANQRHKSHGMFSSVEGAYDSKTIEFDQYAVGRKGNGSSRSSSRERIVDGDFKAYEISGGTISCPGERDDARPGVEITDQTEKECRYEQNEEKVSLNVMQFFGGFEP